VNNGKTEAVIAPFSNMAYMHEHLKLISVSTPSGKHAVVIMDQASWHQQHLDNAFDNLTIIHIPPYSPELNPIEQVWSWLRQNELANRCFSGYEDIVNSCSDAWNIFCEDKNRVMSLCFRNWVKLIS